MSDDCMASTARRVAAMLESFSETSCMLSSPVRGGESKVLISRANESTAVAVPYKLERFTCGRMSSRTTAPPGRIDWKLLAPNSAGGTAVSRLPSMFNKVSSSCFPLMFCKEMEIDLEARASVAPGGLWTEAASIRRRRGCALNAGHAFSYLRLCFKRRVHKDLGGAEIGGNPHIRLALEFFF